MKKPSKLTQRLRSYIIETCYEAEQHARYAGRQKVKVDDFQFALRNDPKKLGRIQEMAEKEKGIKSARKVFDLPEGEVPKGYAGGEEGAPVKGKRGRKKRVSNEDGALGSSPAKKKRKDKDGAGSSAAGGARGEIGEEDLDMDLEDVEDD